LTSFTFLMIAVQMAEPAKTDMAARITAKTDTINPKTYNFKMHRRGPLGGTKASEPRPKASGKNRTYATRDVSVRTEPSNKR